MPPLNLLSLLDLNSGQAKNGTQQSNFNIGNSLDFNGLQQGASLSAFSNVLQQVSQPVGLNMMVGAGVPGVVLSEINQPLSLVAEQQGNNMPLLLDPSIPVAPDLVDLESGNSNESLLQRQRDLTAAVYDDVIDLNESLSSNSKEPDNNWDGRYGEIVDLRIIDDSDPVSANHLLLSGEIKTPDPSDNMQNRNDLSSLFDEDYVHQSSVQNQSNLNRPPLNLTQPLAANIAIDEQGVVLAQINIPGYSVPIAEMLEIESPFRTTNNGVNFDGIKIFQSPTAISVDQLIAQQTFNAGPAELDVELVGQKLSQRAGHLSYREQLTASRNNLEGLTSTGLIAREQAASTVQGNTGQAANVAQGTIVNEQVSLLSKNNRATAQNNTANIVGNSQSGDISTISTAAGIEPKFESGLAKPLMSGEISQPLNLKQGFTPNLAMRIQWMVSQASSAAEIMMDPPELGPLNVKLHYANGETNLMFQVANPMTKDAIEENLARLKEMLLQQGISLGETMVEQRDQQDSKEHNESTEQSAQPNEVVNDEGSSVSVLSSEQLLDVYS